MGTDARWLMPLILVTFCISGIHCAKSESQDEGGQHTGGGNVISSKPEDINSTLDLAIKLAAETNEQKNIFVQFVKTLSAEKSNTLEFKRIFPNYVPGHKSASGIYESKVLRALSQNKIIRLENGDCPQSVKGKHADASVSELSLSAEVCFSIGNLTRVLPSVLLRELLSLALHEAIHMAGGEEEEAVQWQEAFSAYFGNRFGDIPSDAAAMQTLKSLSEIRLLLSRAQAIAANDPKDPVLFATVGKMSERLANLPYFDDPLALELKMKPAHPDLISNYSNAILVLIEKIRIRFEMNLDWMSVNGTQVEINLIQAEQVMPALDVFAGDIDRISANFLAVLDENPEVPSECVIPMGDVQLPNKPLLNQDIFGPQQRCSQKPDLF